MSNMTTGGYSETEMRREKVVEWVGTFRPRSFIQEEGRKLWPDLSVRTIDEYIAQAKKKIKEVVMPDTAELMAESLTYWADYIERCRKAGDRKHEAMARQWYEKLMLGVVDNRNTRQSDLDEHIQITIRENK